MIRGLTPIMFTAGGMVRGQSLVVWAIEEERTAARGVDKYPMWGDVSAVGVLTRPDPPG